MVYVISFVVIGLPLLFLIWICQHLWETWQDRNEPERSITIDGEGNVIARSYDYRSVRSMKPTRGRGLAIEINSRRSLSSDGLPESTTTILTWADIVTEETEAMHLEDSRGEDDTTRLRIRWIDTHDLTPSTTTVALQERVMIVRSVTHDPRRRWIELRVS